LGLLLLRATLAGTFILLIADYFSRLSKIGVGGWLICGTVFVFSAALLVGFLTLIFSTLLAISGILLLLAFPAQIYSVFAIYLIILSVALILLGPGAYSVDARLFGLREIVISKKV
jgi:hypothetical protein